MHVESRIKWTLYATLLMISPAILNIFHGRLETTLFAKYFIVAFVLAWFATGVVHKVMIYFKFDTIRRQIEAGYVVPKRRRSDRPATQNQTPSETPPELAAESAPPLAEEEMPAPVE